MASTPGAITEAGLRNNVNVGIQYISSWLRGNGAAGIYGLMEDAATAEISRSQVWQWIRHGRTLEDDGTPITPDLVRRLEGEELERIRTEIGDDEWFEARGAPEGVAGAVRAGRAGRRARRVPHHPGLRAARLSARLRARTSSPAGAAGSAARSSSDCWPTAMRWWRSSSTRPRLAWLDGVRARDRGGGRRERRGRDRARGRRRAGRGARSPAGSTTPRSSATLRSTRRRRASCSTSST